jgi:hypothetical protein
LIRFLGGIDFIFDQYEMSISRFRAKSEQNIGFPFAGVTRVYHSTEIPIKPDTRVA